MKFTLERLSYENIRPKKTVLAKMENKIVQGRVFQESIALRRLYYSHPLVVLKTPFQTESCLQESKMNGCSELVKTKPLLEKRTPSPVKRTLSDGAYNKANHHGGIISPRAHSSCGPRDEVMVISGMPNPKRNKDIRKLAGARNGFNSTPTGARGDGYRPRSVRKPALITAMQINTCNITNDKRILANAGGSARMVHLSEDIHKLNIGMKKSNQEIQHNALSMFQQWGVRKLKKVEQNPITYENNWVQDRCDVEVWSQSVHVFNYKSTSEECKYKIHRLADSKESKDPPPLPPNPSPTFAKSDPSKRDNSEEEDIRCKVATEQKEKERDLNESKEATCQFEIVVIPPTDEWATDVESEAKDGIDRQCLSPTFDDYVYRDYEPLPAKTYKGATEKMIHEVKARKSSRGSIFLEDIVEADDEDDLNEIKCTKL